MQTFHCPNEKAYTLASATASTYYISYVVAGTNMGGTGEANIELNLDKNTSNKCLMTESSQNHVDGVNALFIDTHVKWIPKAPDLFLLGTATTFEFINKSGQ